MGGADNNIHTHTHLQNYDLKAVQTGYRRTMFQQALEYESEQAGKEEVARDTVELAVWEKLQLASETQAELQGLSLPLSLPHPLSTSALPHPLSTSRSL